MTPRNLVCGTHCRNPFYYRSSFIQQLGRYTEAELMGRNPFYYRSSFILSSLSGTTRASICRNPFYYRSSFIPKDEYVEAPVLGRNPFYYRSSFIHIASTSIKTAVESQSLLLQVFIHTNRTRQDLNWCVASRNPFYYRSSFIQKNW